jgi:DHA3 family macrolide efflux protein-like MFS transporter
MNTDKLKAQSSKPKVGRSNLQPFVQAQGRPPASNSQPPTSPKQPQTQEFLGDRAVIVTAFRNRNFSALWIGQLLSQIGDNFVIVAILFVINTLTNSPLALGIMALVATLPQLLLGLVGGVFVDRLDRKLVMIVSDVIRGLAVLCLLLVQRADQLYILYIVAFVMATVGLFFNPARNAIIPGIVSDEILLTANALMQANQIIAVILGASIAGLIVGWLGPASAFVFDSFTFAFSAAAVATMTIPSVNSNSDKTNVRVIWNQLVEGLLFIRYSSSLLHAIITTAVATLGFGAIVVLGIIYLDEVLGIGAQGLGFLYAFQGLGVVVGGMMIGNFASRVRTNRIVGGCMVTLGLAIIAFAVAPSYPLVLVAVAIIGLSIVAARAALVTLTQLLVPNEKLGRVESAVTMVIGASTSASMALSGVFGDLIGVQAVFIAAGVITILAGVAASYTLQGAERVVSSSR